MKQLIKKMNKNVEFSHHALERGLQIGMSQEDLAFCLREAHKATREEKKAAKMHGRVYRSGSTYFAARNYPEKIVIITVWDEMALRNEGYKLSW
jgi:hypothetical protein